MISALIGQMPEFLKEDNITCRLTVLSNAGTNTSANVALLIALPKMLIINNNPYLPVMV